MTKLISVCIAVLFLVALVNCNKERQRAEAEMQKVLEEHAESISMGLTGRLASAGRPGVVGARIPPVHQHLDGHRPNKI